MKKSQLGFTLMEIMIAVAILGLIAAVGIPSYRRYVVKTDRKAAIAEMLNVQQQLERGFNNNRGAYSLGDTDPLLDTLSCSSSRYTYPSNSVGEAKYIFNVAIANSSSYVITAQPCGGQTQDKCGTLTIDNFDVKTSSESTAQDCF